MSAPIDPAAQAAPGPWSLLETARTVLAVHAHPDDESLATGALLRHLADSGVRTVLVTATRGEEGEIVPGSVDPGDARDLEEIRSEEIDRACAALGVRKRHLLGQAPALAEGAAPRRYRDSGMRWVREGLAGPSETAGPTSFTHRPMEQSVADLRALIEQLRPDAVLGYDDEGTYGHPDHVHAHHVTRAACAQAGVPMLQVASDQGASADWRELPHAHAAVAAALDAYRTQLTVVDAQAPAIRIRHVGGQDDEVPMRSGLTLAPSAAG